MYDYVNIVGTKFMGRNKEYPDRLTLPLAEGVVARLDEAREEGETRLDVIRVAIERELKRRSKARPE